MAALVAPASERVRPAAADEADRHMCNGKRVVSTKQRAFAKRYLGEHPPRHPPKPCVGLAGALAERAIVNIGKSSDVSKMKPEIERVSYPADSQFGEGGKGCAAVTRD
jgi:hypothetical protein